jgi:hypothetical protein
MHTKNSDVSFACSVRSSYPWFTSRQVCLTLENARLMLGQWCVARSPGRICTIKQLPSSGPKFHHPLVVDGVGRSTRASLAVLKS